ncbi:hypothetical protein [Mesorhizobium sp. CO1-1-9]|uniref:hypothetical protein n=1 Tax=Mesorhizobium sp. CO1-1-9 TaxID=2876630 RepID=UPI00398C4F15
MAVQDSSSTLPPASIYGPTVFDGTLAEIFDLQDQIASNIVGAITPKIEEAEIERAKCKPRSLRSQPNYASAMRVAMASHALAGQLSEAEKMRACANSIPHCGFRTRGGAAPFQRVEDRDNYIEGLRKADLPE